MGSPSGWAPICLLPPARRLFCGADHRVAAAVAVTFRTHAKLGRADLTPRPFILGLGYRQQRRHLVGYR